MLILSVPLTISLLISFNFTIWILSIITTSSLTFGIIIVIDLFVSLIMPPLMLTLIVYGFVLLSVFLAHGLVDYTTFEEVNLLNFSIASTGLQFTGSLLIPSISSWLIYNTSGLYYHVEVILLQLHSLYTHSLGNSLQI